MELTVVDRLRHVIAGDREAAAWLYDCFATSLFQRLGRRYGYLTLEEREDVLQDTFVHALRHDGRLLASFLERAAGTAPEPGDLERFLWDQACGLVANRRRSRLARRWVPLGDEDEAEPDPVSAEQRLIDRDSLRKLDHCLRDRGQRVYLYFQLRYADGLAPEEIVAATGWSRKATYKLRQALNRAVDACLALLRRLPG